MTNADYTTNVPTPNPPINAQAVYVENTQMERFAYDAVGNRTSEKNKTQSKTITLVTNAEGVTTRTEETAFSPEQTTTATFNALNELTQLDEPNNVSNFTYDNNGNLTQISKNAAIISKYEYDARNQLTSAKDGINNELASFDYDFERKRISKTGANGYQSYVYAGNQVVNEFNAFSTATAKYTIGAGEVVKSEFGNTENNYHFTDALGSVTSLAKLSDGSLTSRNEYNAFGEVAVNGNSANSIGYTGQRLDNETGLMALGNGERYYSPNYTRFIQQDRVGGNQNDPASLNRYSYAHNNPNKFTDPSGNFVVAFIVIPFLLGVAFSVIEQDQEIRSGERRQEDFSMSEAAVNYTVIGTGFRAATGTDAVTGRELSGGERAFAIAETALEFTSIVGKTAGLLAKSAKVASAANILGNTAELGQAAIGVYRGGNSTVDLVQKGEYGAATLTGILTALGGYGGFNAYKGIKAEMPNWKLFPPGVGIDGVGLPSVRFVGGKTNSNSSKETALQQFLSKGTLEREKSTYRLRNIIADKESWTQFLGQWSGKYKKRDFSIHHLISVEDADISSFEVMIKAKELGYNINRGNNLLELPNSVTASKGTGLPLHTKRHLGEYSNAINERVGRLNERYIMGLVKDENIVDEIGKIEDSLRSDLLNRRLKLQSNDPNF